MGNWYGLQDLGLVSLVCIHGRSCNDILDDFNGFYNHGATDGKLVWLHEGVNEIYSAYFWTTHHKLEKCLEKRCLFRLLNADPMKFKGIKGGAKFEAKRMAKDLLECFQEEVIVSYGEKSCNTCKLGAYIYCGPSLPALDIFPL